MKNTYSEMKNSGVAWIGDIPTIWDTKHLFQLTIQVKNKNSALSEQNLLSLSYGKIKRKSIETTEGLLPASFDNYNIVEKDDIVLRLTDLQNDHTSLRVGKVEEKGIITSAYVSVRPVLGVSKYIYYALHSFDLKKGFYGMGSGVRQGLNFTEAKMIRIPFPELPEQTAIAAYLDEKCGTIDEIIAEAKASIEEYKAWKSSVIFEAVTKGLDPHAEMKDSGVDIIGLMPKHWNLCRQRFLCKTTTGDHDTQDAELEGAFPFYVRSPIIERSNTYTFDGEGVLMAGDGAGAGRVFHYATGKYAIHQRVYCFYDFKGILPRFYHYFMENLFCAEMDKGSAKSTVPSVRLPMLKDFNICLPSLTEQANIITALDEKCAAIDGIIAEKEALIADMEAYKKSLIFETVTGKRKVC